MNEVRIDKWMWATRIFKTRTIAAEACKKNRVMINGGGIFLLFVGEVEGQARVDDSLTAEDIFIVAAGETNVFLSIKMRILHCNGVLFLKVCV